MCRSGRQHHSKRGELNSTTCHGMFGPYIQLAKHVEKKLNSTVIQTIASVSRCEDSEPGEGYMGTSLIWFQQQSVSPARRQSEELYCIFEPQMPQLIETPQGTEQFGVAETRREYSSAVKRIHTHNSQRGEQSGMFGSTTTTWQGQLQSNSTLQLDMWFHISMHTNTIGNNEGRGSVQTTKQSKQQKNGIAQMCKSELQEFPAPSSSRTSKGTVQGAGKSTIHNVWLKTLFC